MLYHLPIEPYKTRYTADWIQQYEDEFTMNQVWFQTVLGQQATDVIGQGSVLDACGTHLYKFSQLSEMIKLINSGSVRDNDVIFVSDLWFPGIEALFYIRDITKIQFKIAGILHAGTYDKADFTVRNGMRPWGKHLESSWFYQFDMIFVATEFHKKLILDNTIEYPTTLIKRIKVTGLPFYASSLNPSSAWKEDIVVFPHRVEAEKHPEIFDEFSQMREAEGWKFVKTIEVTKSREEYFDLLKRSKIMLSFADQETFGYSTLESMALGNVVIVPNELSYKETVPAEFRYNSMSEAKELFKDALRGVLRPNYPDILKWEDSVLNMVKEMRKEGWNV